MSGQAVVLEAQGVVKRYGAVTALAGVSLSVPARSCTALVGESGSGKTTLLRTFNRMVDTDDGAVRVHDEDVRAADPVTLRRALGYVEQAGGLLPHWTVLRNVALVPWLVGSERADALAAEALERVGLPPAEYGARWPRELSGGQRQRAALARALAGGARTLLLDEPFGALDAISRQEVRRTYAELQRALGLTTLLVTHDLREAFDLADQVAVLRAGRVEQVADPERLRTSPATEYVAELLDKAGVA